ncbi:MAG TPA: HisA/HisF-related TIM barrel protein [Candidatus Sulfotelmatobacter sp.]|nr:HisA/HisF-related TIM barrel protein [Candidatus Sulfotelmatobacter sp.]
MLIPSIDLMGGKIVQLVQGKKKALEFDDQQEWVIRFSRYPIVQLIDLDAAMRKGSNQLLVKQIAKELPCQVGGGIRSIGAAAAALASGARKVIVGSALFSKGVLDCDYAEKLSRAVGPERLVFALDAIGERVAICGWQRMTDIRPLEMMKVLDPWCGAFLYTHVNTEGLLQGFPQEVIRPLRAATERQLIAAGGIRSAKEVDELHAMGVDAVVGMAIYKGIIPA